MSTLVGIAISLNEIAYAGELDCKGDIDADRAADDFQPFAVLLVAGAGRRCVLLFDYKINADT
jgi:hypothetical protein